MSNYSVDSLRDPALVRSRAHEILSMAKEGKLKYFSVYMDRMDSVAALVAGVIRENYPDLDIPYHARWRHFTAGDEDRWGKLSKRIKNQDKAEIARTGIDLAVISVLLDAGAGGQWSYYDTETEESYTRSEGLAVASFDMFKNGLFSDDPDNPLRVDAKKLAGLKLEDLVMGFQVTEDNPMIGLEGRLTLLQNMATALQEHSDLFGADTPRPGGLFDYLTKGNRKTVKAADILKALLDGFSAIWPGRIEIDGQNMGDVWRYDLLSGDGMIPFHKLSQWLAYSLLEPFEWAGIKVTGLDDLTGLAEYRNGGLMLESGLIGLKKTELAQKEHDAGDGLIIEWRALTIALLDELRLPVAERLDVKDKDFPLAKLLEGGTWWAGRKLAFMRDPAGSPPLNIKSDGTVF